jgi:glycosyltransferase involved in cell wall biosynthesis
MKCDCIIPVGPGHQEVHYQALESIRIATLSKGPFSIVSIRVIDDTNGEKGRSRCRNQAVAESDADWIFFLDADDRMHPDAFRNVQTHINTRDAIWGNIWEYSNGVAVWRYQVPEIRSYEELISFDPYVTLQMGHFIKREKFIPFNEDMDCGEDWDYYLKVWMSCDCIKIRDPLFLNQRGIHSTGPRSATGADWNKVVGRLIQDAKLLKNPT